MAELKITKPPEPCTVDEGKDAKFTATATGKAPFKFSWKVGDAEWGESKDPGGDTSTHTIAGASRVLNGAEVRVRVTDADTQEPVESEPVALTVISKDELVLWVGGFAWKAALACALAALVVLIPSFIALSHVLDSSDDKIGFPAAIAVLLIAVGIFVVAAGVLLALLEFRGRARTLEELRALLPDGQPAAEGIPGLADLFKALPETLKAFGQLRAVAALLAMATVLFVCGTVIAVEVADTDEPTTTTTDTTSAADEPSDSTTPAVDEPSENVTTGP